MTGFELVHVAAADGLKCALCGRPIALEAFPYPPGARVVVVDHDAGGSWLVNRPPTCQQTWLRREPGR
jgi:hypothetical protein